MLRDRVLIEPGVKQPRFQVFEIPPVKSDLANIVLVEQFEQQRSHVLVAHCLAGSGLQKSFVAPDIVRHLVLLRLVDQSYIWQPEGWLDVPRIVDLADKYQRSEVSNARKVQSAVQWHSMQISIWSSAFLPSKFGNERVSRFNSPVEYKVLILCLPCWHPPRIFGHRKDFLAVHEDVECRVGLHDGLFPER